MGRDFQSKVSELDGFREANEYADEAPLDVIRATIQIFFDGVNAAEALANQDKLEEATAKKNEVAATTGNIESLINLYERTLNQWRECRGNNQKHFNEQTKMCEPNQVGGNGGNAGDGLGGGGGNAACNQNEIAFHAAIERGVCASVNRR